MLDSYLRYIYKLFFYFLICLYVLAACETTDCITFNTRIVIVDFLDSATGASKSRQFDLISAQESQVIFYSDTSLSTYFLPVNTELEQTLFLWVAEWRRPQAQRTGEVVRRVEVRPPFGRLHQSIEHREDHERIHPHSRMGTDDGQVLPWRAVVALGDDLVGDS